MKEHFITRYGQSLTNVSQSLNLVYLVETPPPAPPPPFLSPTVKHLLKLRKNAIRKNDNERNRVSQERVNCLIRQNQLKAAKQENKNQNCGSKRWWSLVNNVTGRANSEVPLSSIFDPKRTNISKV